MSTTQFLAESRTLLQTQERELKRYLDILSTINTGKLDMLGALKFKLIEKLKEVIFDKGSYEENGATKEAHGQEGDEGLKCLFHEILLMHYRWVSTASLKMTKGLVKTFFPASHYCLVPNLS